MKYLIPNRMQALEALRHLFPSSSRRTLQHWIKGGRFLVDEKPLEKDSSWLEEGQTLSAQEQFSPPEKSKIKIYFHDRHVIVVEKPPGLLSVPLDTPTPQMHTLRIVRAHFKTDQIFAVHRLDRETSGVMIFARGMDARKKFKDLFETHSLQREYIAIVEGILPENSGTWRCNLLELQNFDVVASPEGKEAITHFEVLHRSAKYTYLRLRLETGRKHQIRVHCKLAGVPVLGDGRYGAKESPIKRMALHAKMISFVHPFTQKELLFTSPLPFTFKKLLPPKLNLEI